MPQAYPMDKPIEILLVEDNEDDVLLVRQAFAAAKLLNLVATASDGQEAIDMLVARAEKDPQHLPGMILMDINMPRRNGFDVLNVMKHHPTLARIPVVMLTSSARDEDVVRSFSYGAVSYVRKPVDFARLCEIVKQFSLYWTLVSRVPNRGD
jgi:CheY-like chemotaxis protein